MVSVLDGFERVPWKRTLKHSLISFSAYLAARLSCPPAAVIGPGLAARLVRAGVPKECASRTAGLMEDAVGARYGGDAGESAGWAAAVGLVRELEASFRAASKKVPASEG